MKHSTLRLAVLVVAYLTSVASTSAPAKCTPPHYRPGRIYKDSPSTFDGAVSISWAEFVPQRLVCLAEELKKRYQNRQSISVLVFSSSDAAKYYVSDVQIGDSGPPQSEKQARLHSDVWLAKQLHAIYVYDARKNEEYLTFKPYGYLSNLPEDTRINLPVMTVPRCRLEVRNRCLVALDQIDSVASVGAFEAMNAKTSGTVTLTGKIASQGQVTQIQVAEASSMPIGRTEPFVRASVDNLKTWRFESSPRPDVLKITYSYVLDSSAPRSGVLVEFALPNQITIRAKPPD